MRKVPLAEGTRTAHGTVVAVSGSGPNRCYWVRVRGGVEVLMPWQSVEPDTSDDTSHEQPKEIAS